MFIRIKNIKGNKYAYRVKNKWTRRGTRQKTVGYLGKVYKLEPEKDKQELDFHEYINNEPKTYYKKSTAKQLILDVIRYELYRHGFKRIKSRMKKHDIIVNLSTLKINHGKKSAVLNLNNDFLCSYTLRKLVKFRSASDQEECGKELAQAFISAGIAIKPEIFVEIFPKVYSRYGVSMVE